MVNSYVYYTGDGSTDNFQITFDYLSKEFVQVYLDGIPLVVETDYIFAGDRTIVIPSIPASGSIVFIQRVTSKNRLVEFRDASILVANDLDISALQAIHIAEEANDNIQNAIQADAIGNFDVLNRRLVNVGDPINDTDGTNKLYVDTRFAADVSAAVAARDAAVVAQGLSEDARDAAQGFANTADVRATQAAGSAVVAAQSAQDAQTAADFIGVMQSRGVLLTGQDTISLTWPYNPALKNVAVYLDGVKQDADTALIYTDANTITLTEPVTEATNWEVISVTLAGDSTFSGYVDQCQDIVNNAALSNLPVGFFGWHTGKTPPAGWVQADGLLKSRAAFPALWAFAQASGNISVDDASWTFGTYSPGDGSTTFRVPDLRDQFIRGASGSRVVGNAEQDQNKKHNHGGGAHAHWTGNSQLSGHGRNPEQVSGRNRPDGSGGGGFEGSTSGPKTTVIPYDGGAEARPVNVAYLPCIKAYDVISDPNVLNTVAVVNDIADVNARVTSCLSTVANDIADVNARVTPCLSMDEYLYVRDEKPSGTGGGTSSTSTWHTRDLNAIKTNTIVGAVVAGNSITLPAGTYYIRGSAPAFRSNRHSLRVLTDSGVTQLLFGGSGHIASNQLVVTYARVAGIFNIASTKTLTLSHYIEVGFASEGLGVSVATTSMNNVYSEVEIWKIG